MIIAIIIILLILICFFAASHAALKTFSRKRLADLLESSGKTWPVDRLIERIPKLLLLTGAARTTLSVGLSLLVLYDLQQRFPTMTTGYLYAIAFGISAGLISVVAVAIPISWARYRRERLLLWALPVLNILLVVLMPLASLLNVSDPIVRRIVGADNDDDDDNDISEQVLTVVEDHQAGETVDQIQKDMLEAVFDLPNTNAGEIMTPRTDVKGIESSSTLDEVRQYVLDYGHSRIPVYEESLDHIQGILYAKDLIPVLGNGDKPFDIRDVMRDAYMVPESKRVSELLSEFKARKIHLAVVLDEYGGTAGLVTIEDIIEEIVGEIQDEYELVDEKPLLEAIDDTASKVDARMDIDDLADEFDFTVPEDADYDTVGGFVFAQLGHIPAIAESFTFEDTIRVTVVEAERTRVVSVRVEKLTDGESTSVEGDVDDAAQQPLDNDKADVIP